MLSLQPLAPEASPVHAYTHALLNAQAHSRARPHYASSPCVAIGFSLVSEPSSEEVTNHTENLYTRTWVLRLLEIYRVCLRYSDYFHLRLRQTDSGDHLPLLTSSLRQSRCVILTGPPPLTNALSTSSKASKAYIPFCGQTHPHMLEITRQNRRFPQTWKVIHLKVCQDENNMTT